jgi:sec-independent protein translocase protein TatA
MPDLSIPPAALAVFGLPGGMEWIIILVIGLLLFGRRLPEVGRSLGQGIVEFKKGLKGVADEVEKAGEVEYRKNPQLADRPQHDPQSTAKAEPRRAVSERATESDE